jgi:hypothetical protein
MAIITDSDLPNIYTSVDIDGNSAGSWFYFNGQTDFTEANQHGTDQILLQLQLNKRRVFKEDLGDNTYKYFTVQEADLQQLDDIKKIAVDYAVAFILRQNWIASGGDTDSAMYLEMKERENAAEVKVGFIPISFDENGDSVEDVSERQSETLSVHKLSR